MTKQKAAFQENTDALTELWWPMPSLQLPAQAHPVTLALLLLPAGSQTEITAYFNRCAELQVTTD